MIEFPAFDPIVSQALESIRNEPLTMFMRLMSATHGAFLIILPLIGIWLWRGKGSLKKRLLIFFAFGLSIAINNGVCDFIKVRVERPRPFEAQVVSTPIESSRLVNPKKPHRSFPSGHSMNSLAAVILALFLWPRIKPWLLILPALIGFSRIYLGVHYLTDVLAGFTMGAIIGVLLGLIARKLLSLKQSSPEDAPNPAAPIPAAASTDPEPAHPDSDHLHD